MTVTDQKPTNEEKFRDTKLPSGKLSFPFIVTRQFISGYITVTESAEASQKKMQSAKTSITVAKSAAAAQRKTQSAKASITVAESAAASQRKTQSAKTSITVAESAAASQRKTQSAKRSSGEYL